MLLRASFGAGGAAPGARISGLFAVLLACNLLSWGWALLAFRHAPALLGAALLAWGFGLRHAVDADHIAAIDNVTRRLMQSGQRPITVGLFFSLGHSAVVVLASLALVLAQGWFRARMGVVADWGAPIGTAVSAGFLLLIGASNAGVLVALLRRRRDAAVRTAPLPAAAGGLSRVLSPLFRRVARPGGMVWLGLLFGLGFDTATEIGVLGLAANGATHGQVGWNAMAFPALFASGMSLVDTADGVLMLGAYGWAMADPARKLGYNAAITAGSVLIALVIGLSEAFNLSGIDPANAAGPARALAALAGFLDAHAETVGYAAIAGFTLLWTGALLRAWRPRTS
jgi:nickel/cobalt transporter (NiCoT) family protein